MLFACKMKLSKGRETTADLLKVYVGEDVAAIVRELAKKKDYSEFKLAEAVKKEVNETRNLLYKLYSLNLASFVKKKDNKIGWYIHYWTFHEGRVGQFLLSQKEGRLAVLKELVLKEGKSGFYSCPNSCVSVDFDLAFELSFSCPECGGLLSQENNAGKEREWEEEIALLEKDIKILERQKMSASEERLNENTRLDEFEKAAKKKKRSAL